MVAPYLTGSQVGSLIRLEWSVAPSVASSGRYLLDGSGVPFLILSDSPQGMLVTRSTTDFATYFAARAGQGFNMSQVHVIAGPTFGGGANGETYDSIAPFTSAGDISTPNSTYFARLDTLVETARQYGIVVMLTAAEMIDFHDLWKTNGNTKCYNWGAYLGNRYKDYPNVVWNVGNDFQDWSTDTDSVAALVNVLNGIQSADTNHLRTAWLDYYHSASRDSTDFNAEIELDFGYTYYISYDKIAEEYALSPAKPVFLGESYYQDYSTLSLTGTPLLIRRQNYWAMLRGACGVTVMNVNWPLGDGWDTDMTKLCFTQIAHLKALFEAYNWHLLIPDTSHVYLTNGYATEQTGTVQPDAANPAALCAYLADGSLAIIYMPTNRTMTVDMSQFSGSVVCRWFDPTDGSYTADAASPHANTGTHDFSRATNNSAGETDWLLVLSV